MKIGTTSFKDSVSSILPLSLKIEEQLSNKSYLHLYSRKYIEQKWNEVMEHISQIDVDEMQLSDNDYEHILKEISPISFPNLTSLSLISNQIKSIESLCQVQMPSLKICYLCRNNISKLSPMKKAQWTNLTSLIINDNPIVDCNEVLPQCNFPTLNFIIIEGWADSNVFVENIAFLFKMQSTSLKYLSTFGEKNRYSKLNEDQQTIIRDSLNRKMERIKSKCQ